MDEVGATCASHGRLSSRAGVSNRSVARSRSSAADPSVTSDHCADLATAHRLPGCCDPCPGNVTTRAIEVLTTQNLPQRRHQVAIILPATPAQCSPPRSPRRSRRAATSVRIRGWSAASLARVVVSGVRVRHHQTDHDGVRSAGEHHRPRCYCRSRVRYVDAPSGAPAGVGADVYSGSPSGRCQAS